MGAPRRLVDWPWVTVEVECPLCGRAGRYRLARLAERLGCAFALAELLHLVSAGCTIPGHDERTRQYEARCGVRYRVPRGGPDLGELPARAVPPDEPPLRPRPRRRGPSGPLPTVGGALAEGRTAVLVYCTGRARTGYTCHHLGRIDLAALALPPDLPFVHIPRLGRLRCSRCGSRQVEVRSDWPDPRDVQASRMSGGVAPMREANGIRLPEGGVAPSPER